MAKLMSKSELIQKIADQHPNGLSRKDVRGCPCLRSGVDHVIGHVVSSGVPLAVVPPSLLHD
jgi:hypothetical protein